MDKLDILQRDEFVKQLERMIENISENKVSTCFAINGKWGSGKTFVLDMLQERLEENKANKLLIINILLFVIIAGSMTIMKNQ